ncbi:amidohydrolase family protein [Algimonas porphyrae]
MRHSGPARWAAPLICAALICSCGPSKADSPDLIISDVSLFDSETGKVVPDQSVFIEDGVIVAIRSVSDTESAPQIIDGNDRLLIPGLIDTHIHMRHQVIATRTLSEKDWPRLAQTYLDHGVTTVAEMGQPPAWVPTLVAWQNTPVAHRPDMVLVAGSIGSTHDWDETPPPHHVLVASPDEARAQVRRYRDQGARRIKLYWKLERPELTAAIDEAAKLGVTPYGHIDNGFVNIADAIDDGLRNFEHVFTLTRSVSSPDPMIALIRQQTELRDHETLDEWTRGLTLYHDVIERTPTLRADMDLLIDRLAETRSSISTALNVLAANAGQSDVYSGFDPYPPRSEPDIRPDFVDPDYARAAFLNVMVQVRRAHEAGVMIRLGTDASNGGEAALAELQLLARSGIPIADVLRIGTINGARALNIDDRAGSIAVGRPADMVLFEQNPFADPVHFRAGVTVVKSGVVHVPATRPVEAWLAAYRAEGLAGATQWLTDNPDARLHPSDIAAAMSGYMHDGNIVAAQHMIDQLRHPATQLNGEAVEDYFSKRFMRRAAYRLLEEGELNKATQLFQLRVDLFPQDADAIYGLGDARATAGQHEAAITAYQSSLALDPDNENAVIMIERLRGLIADTE